MNGLSDETIREIAVTAGKSVEFVQGITNYISDIIGAPIKLGVQTFVTDPLSTFRNVRLIEFMSNVQTKMIETGVTDVSVIAPKVVLPLLDSAILEDEPVLQEMWENLLVSAVSGYEVEKHFVKTLDLFTPSNAQLLNYLYPLRYMKEHQLRKFSAGDTCRKAGVEEHDVRSLIRFGIIDSTYEEITYGQGHDRNGSFDLTVPISNGLEEFKFTEFGLSFSKRIIVERNE